MLAHAIKVTFIGKCDSYQSLPPSNSAVLRFKFDILLDLGIMVLARRSPIHKLLEAKWFALTFRGGPSDLGFRILVSGVRRKFGKPGLKRESRQYMGQRGRRQELLLVQAGGVPEQAVEHRRSCSVVLSPSHVHREHIIESFLNP